MSLDKKDHSLVSYNAFMSYSHKGEGKAAPILQRTIESFLDSFLGQHSIRVFRDESNIPMSQDLWQDIVSSLDRSSFFLLLASPESRKSEWVKREVDYYVNTLKRGKYIGIVLMSGSTPWTDSAADLKDSDCALDPTVYKMLISNGTEPKVVDLRDFRTTQGGLRTNARYREQVADIVAKLKDIDKDHVLNAHARERNRRITIFATLILLVLVTSLYGLSEFQQRQLAEETAIRNEAATLAADAYEVIYRNPLIALERAYRSYVTWPLERSIKAQRDAHRIALKHMHASAVETTLLSGKEFMGSARRFNTQFMSKVSPDGRYELRAEIGKNSTAQNNVYLVSRESGYMRALQWPRESKPKGKLTTFGFFNSHNEIFVLKGYNLLTFDLDGNFINRVHYAGFLSTKNPVHLMTDILDKELFLAATPDGAVWLFNPKSGKKEEIEKRESPRGSATRLITSPSGAHVIVIFEDGSAILLTISAPDKFVRTNLQGKVLVANFYESFNDTTLLVGGHQGSLEEYSLKGNKLRKRFNYTHHDGNVRAVAFTENGTHFVTLTSNGNARIWKLGSSTPDITLTG